MIAKIVRIFVIIIVSIILLNVILFLLFSIPSIQKRAADFAIEKIEPIIGTNVSLDGIRIRLFNTVELNGLYIEDQQQDTLLYAESITARIRALELLKNRLYIQKAGLDEFHANVYRESPEEPFNFQFIIDAFVSEDTVVVDEDKRPMRITADELILKNGTLSYHVLSEPLIPNQFNVSHLEVENFNLRINADFRGIEDMHANVEFLTLIENNSGLYVSELKTNIVGKDSTLKSSGLNLSLNQSEINVRNALYDLETKEFSVTVNSNRLEPRDIGIFYEPLNNLDKLVTFDIEAEGQIPNAILSKLEFQYGENTRLNIAGDIDDFNDFRNSNLNVDIIGLSFSQTDLESIIQVWSEDYNSAPQLTALGDIKLRLTALGKISQFNYNGFVDTEQGDINLNGVGRIGNGMTFQGPVGVDNFLTANVLGDSIGVGDVTLNSDIKVVIPQHNDSIMTIAANGSIESVTYKDFLYNDINFEGVYRGTNVNAHINMDNPLNQFNLSGDISFGEELSFLVKGDVDRLDLRPFIMMENWNTPYLSTNIDVQVSGKTVDEMIGTVAIENTSLADSNFIYNPGPVYIQASADSIDGKKIQLMSTFLEAEITGDYYFTTIGEDMMDIIGMHLPSLVAQSDSDQMVEVINANSDMLVNGNNNFQFNILLKNTEDFAYTFDLPFYNVDHATITGNVDVVNSEGLKINAHIPRIIFGNNDIRETKIDLQGSQNDIGLNVNTYLVQDNGYINAHLNSIAVLDSVINYLNYDLNQSNTNSKGELLISMGFDSNFEDDLATNIHIHPVTIDFNGKEIKINEALIAMGNERIVIDNFGIREDEMLLLGVEGVASRSEADNVRVYFNNTELANILAAFNVTNLAGAINGSIYVRQALDTPMIRTEELRIEHIAVNNDTIGTLMIEGDWDQTYSGLNLNSYLVNEGTQSLSIKGFIPTGDESPYPMGVTIDIDNFEMYALQPLATDLFSELSGYLNSNIEISGSVSEPIIEGWLGINEGELRIAYSNVTYFISDTIDISRDNVGFENLVIRDQNNNTATLDVSLSHSNFGRLIYSAGIELDDFMLLNNEDRTDLMAYGNFRISGNLNVTGSPMGIYGDGELTTESPSEVTVVLPQTAKATEYSGVIYINNPQEDSLAFLRKLDDPTSYIDTRVSSGIPIVMDATINLTPLFEAEVVLDPTTGNALEVSGEGEINVNFNSKATPLVRLYGDYVIESGNFHYNLQSLRTIDFIIREGSRLTMEGDPLNTQFNIIAYLPVRADLAALSPTFSTELANTRVPVNALLQIRGDLEAMELEYDIELPESSNDIQQRVNSFISDEETKILQFAYLATTGSFIPSEGSPDMNFGSNVFTNLAATTLSRGLDALFASALSDNWSISTNLESIDGTMDNVRMGVDVSTRLLNNRLRVSTNLSYGDNTMLASQHEFMGEFELEYDINNWLMMRAFNRANERFYRRTPTTQGIGVVVTKEAQSIRDLFNFRFTRPKDDDDE